MYASRVNVTRRRGQMGGHNAPRAGKPHVQGEPILKDEDDQRAAHMAENVYLPPAERAKSIMGYKLDEEMQGKRHAVYHNKEKQHTMMALRGTKPTDAKDLYSDMHIMRGSQRSSHEFRNDKKLYEQVKNKYKGHRITATGHSLGGNRASALTRAKGIESIGFNKGQSLFDKTSIADKMRCKLPKSMRPSFCGKSKQHLIAGGALSASERVVGQSSSNTVYDAPKGMSTGAKHSMSNFTNNHTLTAGYARRRGLTEGIFSDFGRGVQNAIVQGSR